MGEKYDGWGVGGSPRTIDKRKIRRVGRGGGGSPQEDNTKIATPSSCNTLTTRREHQNHDLFFTQHARHGKITAISRPLLHATTPPQADNTKISTSHT